MSQNRHEPYEELISASLHNELNPAERDRLNGHLDACVQCRETLAAFSNQRRIVAGLRHVPPPRDLDARIRSGIERGAAAGPWWKRPQVALAGIGGGLALVAGAAFALVLLNNPATTPPIGQASSTASIEVAPSGTPLPTLPPPASAGPSSAPSVEASPTETPAPPPEPKVFLALTGPVDNQLLTVRDGPSTDTVMEVGDVPSGGPIAAELSPDGQWLAYITQVGETGLTEVRATRVAEGVPSEDPAALPPIDSPVGLGETVFLGESLAGSPFLEHLFWSPDSRYLAFTLADPSDEGTDAWLFLPGSGTVERRTNVGHAYAASWAFGGAGSSGLWVSVAGETPRSYLMAWHDDAGQILPQNPAEQPFGHAENVFQPLVSPDGDFVIFWSGRMEERMGEWVFAVGGAPWLAENTADGNGGFEFTNARELFSDVTIGRDAFVSAAITWGGDSDAFAVWDAKWTGLPQSGQGLYPDQARVYFGHATDPRRLTWSHAIDENDLPTDAFVVDVKVSPTGRHLVITAAQPRAGVMDPPRADLLLVERNTGDVPDTVTDLKPPSQDGWFGPAAFDGRP